MPLMRGGIRFSEISLGTKLHFSFMGDVLLETPKSNLQLIFSVYRPRFMNRCFSLDVVKSLRWMLRK
jgi:hypothetical protein